MKKFLFHVGVIIFLFAGAIPSDASTQCSDHILTTHAITLDETHVALAEPQSAAILSDGRLVLSTTRPAEVHMFTASGEHIRQLGRSGAGPFEYQRPTIVRTDGNLIYVWDAGNLKMLSFTTSGQQHNEWTGFTNAIADFDLSGDTLFAYMSGITSSPLIRGYLLDNETELFSTGDVSSEHVALSMLEGGGTIRSSGETVFYGSVSDPVIYEYDHREEVTGKHVIDDPDFSVAPFPHDISVINSNRQLVVDYMLENSRFYKLNSLPDGRLLAVLQHGNILYGRNGLTDYSRTLNVHLLDNEGSIISCEQIELDIEVTGDNPVIGYTDNGFLLLHLHTDEDGDFSYIISKVESTASSE